LEAVVLSLVYAFGVALAMYAQRRQYDAVILKLANLERAGVVVRMDKPSGAPSYRVEVHNMSLREKRLFLEKASARRADENRQLKAVT
jgi:hypothetical protein